MGIQGSDAQHPDEAERQANNPSRGHQIGHAVIPTSGGSGGNGYEPEGPPYLGEGTIGTNHSRVTDSHDTTGSTAKQGQRAEDVPMHPTGHDIV